MKVQFVFWPHEDDRKWLTHPDWTLENSETGNYRRPLVYARKLDWCQPNPKLRLPSWRINPAASSWISSAFNYGVLSLHSPFIAWNRRLWWSTAFTTVTLFIPSFPAHVSSLFVFADCWSGPTSSKISASSSTYLAHGFISWWQPWLWGLVTGPGTANTFRFCPIANLAAKSNPLFIFASTTSVPITNPIMILFLLRKFLG